MDQQPARSYTRRVLIAVALAVLLVGLAVLLWQIVDVLLLIFAGFLAALFLRTLTDILSHYSRLPARAALPVVVLILLGALALAGWLFAPKLEAQMEQLAKQIPSEIQHLEAQLKQTTWGKALLQKITSSGGSGLLQGGLISRLTGTVSMLLDIGADAIFVFLVALFIAGNPKMYRAGLLRLVPAKRRGRAGEVVTEVITTLRWWLLGQLISMATIGILTGLALWLLGMKLAFSLGVLAGFLEFIPYAGPILSAVPAILLALAQGPVEALYITLLYIAIHQFEGDVVIPFVHRRTVSLPPALTVSAILIMEALFGFIGILVATPLVAVALVLVKMLYLHDVLGEEVELPRKMFRDMDVKSE